MCELFLLFCGSYACAMSCNMFWALGRRTGRCVRYSAAVSGFKQAGLSRKDMSHKLSRPIANKSQKLTLYDHVLVHLSIHHLLFDHCSAFLVFSPTIAAAAAASAIAAHAAPGAAAGAAANGAKNTVYRRKNTNRCKKHRFTGAKNTGAGRRKHRQPPTGAKNTVYRRNKHGAHILLCKMLLPLDHSGVCLCLVGRSYWLASPSCSCPLTVPGLFGRSCAPWPFGPKSARSSTRATRGPNALSFVFFHRRERFRNATTEGGGKTIKTDLHI